MGCLVAVWLLGCCASFCKPEQLVTARARTCPPVRCQRPAESAPPFNLPASSVLPGDGNYMELEGRLSVSESARHSAPYRHRPQESTLGPSELNPVRAFRRATCSTTHRQKSVGNVEDTSLSRSRRLPFSPALLPAYLPSLYLPPSHSARSLAPSLPPSLPPSSPRLPPPFLPPPTRLSQLSPMGHGPT